MTPSPADPAAAAVQIRECAAVLLNALEMSRPAGEDETSRNRGLDVAGRQVEALARLADCRSATPRSEPQLPEPTTD
ncbi:MAG TPA: hypothetical protein VH092_11395 [Urbifossiella sp.]|jgi:hypothetical protein|nr:hypothetical protein [Urbifossiella sp.]